MILLLEIQIKHVVLQKKILKTATLLRFFINTLEQPLFRLDYMTSGWFH